MSAITATVDRRGILPRGWRDFLFQLSLWFGFLAAYEVARGIADRSTAEAFRNGQWIIDFEAPHTLYELTFQRILRSSDALMTAASWTYWGSQFTVLGLALLWAYLRRNDAFYKFRNAIMLANLIGLIGYIAVPTAPPWWAAANGYTGDDRVERRMLAVGEETFRSAWPPMYNAVDGNPWAAMPSLHFGASVLAAILLSESSRTAGAIGWTYASVLGFALVYLGEHYVVDLLAGLGLVAAVRIGEPHAEPLALAISRAVQQLEQVAGD